MMEGWWPEDKEEAMAKLGYLPTGGGNIKGLLQTGTAFIAALLLIVAVAGCATSSSRVGLIDHGFAFDARLDSPGVTVLNYSYSARSAPEWAVKEGRCPQFDNANLAMPAGGKIYVKWTVNATGEILEQTIDLDDRLPRDMANHKIYFVIKRRQLFVYVITPKLRKQDEPIIGPNKYRYYKVLQVHPSV
jgi:hypothetical protein